MLFWGGRVDVRPNRVAGQLDLVRREEAFHAVVGHADLFGSFGQQLVGQACVGILLLNEARNAHSAGGPQGGSTGVSADTDHDVGLEVAENLTRTAQALPQFEGKGQVGQGKFALQTCDRETLNRVSGSRDAFHFHFSFGSDKQNFSFWIQFSDAVSNRQGREDVAARTAAAYDDFSGVSVLFHSSAFFAFSSFSLLISMVRLMDRMIPKAALIRM